MKQEHYAHVIDKFKVRECFGVLNIWHDEFSKVTFDALEILKDGDGEYVIDSDQCRSHFLFAHIKERDTAEEIIQYIKDTEILFI